MALDKKDIETLLTLQRLDNTLKGSDAEERLDRLRTDIKSVGIELDNVSEVYKNLLAIDPSDMTDAQKELLSTIKQYKDALDDVSKYYENTTKFERYFDKLEKRYKHEIKGIKQISSGLKDMWKATDDFMKPWQKASQGASDYAKAVGLSGKAMDELRKRTISATARGIAANFNYSSDELMKLMEKTTQSLGRNVAINNEGMKNLAAMSRTLGEDVATDMVAKMENFGVSVNEVGSRAGKMFDKAAKSGISMEKYSKNFVDNIKLAQNYTFKNGLKGLESMAKKATELKLDMSAVASFAEKVNTVEGAITTGAKLQVLGGSFASMASPLQMLNESLNNMEGLQDRLIAMVGNLGTFNKETGEVEVSAFNKYRIRTAAEAMGVDYGGLMESVNAQARRNEIARQLPAGVSKEVADLVKNVGVIENGVAGVNIGGKFKAASEITNKDQQDLIELNRSESDDIKDIAVRLRGWEDSISGLKKEKEAIQAQAIENSGVGRGIQNIVNTLAKQTGLLRMIAYTQVGAGIAKGAFNVLNGTTNLFSGPAAAFFKRGSKYSRARGYVKAGGSMGTFKAVSRILSVVAKFAGPIAAITAIATAVWGINKLINNRQKKEMKELTGVDIQGKYGTGQQRKILNYLRDDKKLSNWEFANLPKKLQQKMIESGDAEALGVDVSKFKARGGVIHGDGTGTSDSIPAMLSNGESVMTAEATSRYGGLLSALNQSVGGNPIKASKGGTIIKPRTFSYGGYVAPSAPTPSVNNGGGIAETTVHVKFDDLKVNMPDGTIREIGTSLLKDSTFENNLVKAIEQGLVKRSTGGPYKVTKAYANI